MLKKFMLVIAIFVMCFSNAALAAPVDTAINISVDGRVIDIKGVKPYRESEIILVPAVEVFEKLGCTFEWHKDIRQISILRGDIGLHMLIDDPSMVISLAGSSKREVRMLRVPARLVSVNSVGTTMVPVRDIAEALGESVRWNQDTATVMINSTLYGNEMGNYVMGAFAAEKDGWVYYGSAQDKTAGLYKVNSQTGEQLQLSYSKVTNLSIWGNYIYYINNSAGNKIYRQGLNSLAVEELESGSCSSMVIVEGVIYYLCDDKLYAMNVDGEMKSKRLGEDTISEFCVGQSEIYFTVPKKRNYLYRMNLKGKDAKVLVNNSVSGLSILGSCLYFRNMSENNSWELSQLDTRIGAAPKTLAINPKRYLAVDNYIYYLDSYSALQRFNTEDGSIRLISKTMAADFNILKQQNSLISVGASGAEIFKLPK